MWTPLNISVRGDGYISLNCAKLQKYKHILLESYSVERHCQHGGLEITPRVLSYSAGQYAEAHVEVIES